MQPLLQERFGVNFSTSLIKSTRKKLGWVKSGPMYCKIVKEANRIKRLAFCQKLLADKEKFDTVIFTDKSSIWMEQHGKLCFQKKRMPPKLKPKAKHPYKVHVWAGISKCGATNIVLFTGIMKN